MVIALLGVTNTMALAVRERRRELLDRTLVWNQRHLMTVLREYEDFCNNHRPHRALRQATHLRSADFFDVEKYPEIIFGATSVTLSGETATVSGTLTVRDQVRPVTISGTVTAPGADEISLDAELPVNRGDYGMSFNQLNMMSLDNIITIHAVFTKA